MITKYSDAEISNIMSADKRMQRLQCLRQAVRSTFPIQHAETGDVWAQMMIGTHGVRGDAILCRVDEKEAVRIRQIYDALA
jgi:hypothetical protein